MKSLPRKVLVTLLLLSLSSRLAAAEGGFRLGPPETVAAHAGAFEILKEGDSYEVGYELRFAPRRFRWLPDRLPDLIPVGGLMASSQGTLYGYAGFRFEIPLGDRWLLSPGSAAGLYHRGEGKDLGGPLEFRSHVELTWVMKRGDRLGLCLYHLSNARFFEANPGSESLVLTYSARLRGGRR